MTLWPLQTLKKHSKNQNPIYYQCPQTKHTSVKNHNYDKLFLAHPGPGQHISAHISKQTEGILKTEHTHAQQNFGNYTLRKTVSHRKNKFQLKQLGHHKKTL